jgi:hypothetical protein
MCPSPFSGAFIAIQVPKPRSFKSTIGVHCLESMRPLVPADARSQIINRNKWKQCDETVRGF